ncbi:MAG: UDP-glucose/GDP-mannose dehydrogenase family protein [Bacteroidales bacterium]|nr:UDP-glucose/GDP-mannose dehydrogenase family protein [Bacteroidales bacterium]MCF8333030.1 UDP-glucose/GDP-mannose dehydrogenase family protein [Bacteroidales bacterium]
MKISIVGTGYVGLVTGACFADVGIDVTCVDVDHEKIGNLKKGEIPIYEPGLEDIVHNNVQKKRLHFTTSLKETIDDAEVIFSAVGTPSDKDGSADLKYVLDVAREIGANMNQYVLVVTKSTVPVGTAEKVRQAIKEEHKKRGVDIPFDVASNPEFLKEGAAVEDFLRPDRIVVGTDSDKAENIMKKLYKPFTMNGHPVLFMNIASAEMTKYAANAMLATKISFMNDVANLSEIVGADINMIRKGIGTDKRIGPYFIYPGTGYGGSCFPKDVKAIIKTGAERNYHLRVLEAVEEVNEKQKTILFRKLYDYYNGDLKGKQIAMWGLSFKPNTDDMREAPSLSLIEKLLEAGATIKAYDPVAFEEAKKHVGDKIQYAPDEYDALIDADALLLVTEWSEFKFPNMNIVKRLMKQNAIFDGRNVYDIKEMKELGFDYYCIGIDTEKI